MAEVNENLDTDPRSTDAVEGELDTVEESIRIHEGKGGTVSKTKPPEPNRKSTDLAEGERDTVEESIRIHEEKGDAQGKKAA